MRILLLKSFLAAMTCVVISRGSWALIAVMSVCIFFFFNSSLSFLSLIITFNSLRFYSICSNSLRSVTLAVWAWDTVVAATWLYVGVVYFRGVFSYFLISFVFLRICAIGLAVTINSDALRNASIVCFQRSSVAISTSISKSFSFLNFS